MSEWIDRTVTEEIVLPAQITRIGGMGDGEAGLDAGVIRIAKNGLTRSRGGSEGKGDAGKAAARTTHVL